MDAGRPLQDEESPLLPEQIDQLIADGHYQAALGLATRLVDRTGKMRGTNSTEYAEQLLRLADVYRALHQFTDAERTYRNAVDLYSSTGGENDIALSTSLNGLAVTLIDMRDYVTAEPLLLRALEIDERTLDESSDYRFQTMNNLGMLKFHQGQYAGAEPLLRKTLEARERMYGEGDPRVADSLNQLAAVYQAINDSAKAEPLFKRALHIRRDHSNVLDVAQSLNNLAACYRGMNRYAEAESLYQEAVGIYRARLGEQDFRFANALGNLAGVYFAMGDYGRAEPLVRQALAVRRTFGDRAWAIGATLNNLAMLHYADGRYEAAEPLFREAIMAGRHSVGDRHPKLRNVLTNLAGMYVAMGRPTDALDLWREVVVIDDHLIANVFPMTSESERIQYLLSLQQNLDDMLGLIARFFADSQSVVSEGFDIVLRRKGIVAESLAMRRDALMNGDNSALEARIRELRNLRVRLAEQTLAGPGSDGLDPHKKRLEQLARDADRIEADIAQEVPEENLVRTLENADRHHVAQALSGGAFLVEFVRFTVRDFGPAPRSEGTTHYAAFILEGGAPDHIRLVDLGDAGTIDNLVFGFRKSSARAPNWLSSLVERMRRRRDDGATLRAKIFDPLGLGVTKDHHVFLAPEGTLAWIPFEALPSGDAHLIDHYHISYLSVGRDLLRLGFTPSGAAGDPIVVADPNFDLGDGGVPRRATDVPQAEAQSRDVGASSLYFPRLKGTRNEGERVASILGVQPSLWDAAVESRVKAARSPRVLHLATHGFFLPNQPAVAPSTPSSSVMAGWIEDGGARMAGPGMENPLLRSGLALAGANVWLRGGSPPSGAEDGILNAVDVSSLNLVGTELAVLSACETGLGTVHVWEGVFGLRRAFAIAGAKTLIMSLWKVADDQTSELILTFYEQLLAGQPRAEALRVAQLALKKHYPSPFYWAAFVCQGEPGPLQARNSPAVN
jgi:CHAT domain-containing protein/tetratricopeptide (TPR) repeat protein